MLLKIIAELKTKRILFKACTLSKKRLKYGSKKVNKNANFIPFFFGPLHTTQSSLLFNKNAIDMTASR